MGAKSGERVARNLWWPKLCEEWHCCPAKCGTWSHGLRMPVRELWMTQSSILPLRWIYADRHHYWSASIVTNLPNSISNEVFSELKSDAFLAIIESNSEAGDLSVKGIMDHYCLVQGTWHRHHVAQVQQSIGIEGILTACCILWAKQNSCHLTQIKREKY